jgi:hypothetical protein
MKQIFSFLVISCILIGCGGGAKPNREPVFPVRGKVTYKGQPVVGADVTFTSETANRSAFGRTDDKGEYKLTTFGSNDGAVEGKQTVLISKSLPPVPTKPEASIDSPDYVPPGYGPEPAPPKPRNEIPAKYAAAETSGLIAVVNSDGHNECNFELTD